jgi:hypothetical protein
MKCPFCQIVLETNNTFELIKCEKCSNYSMRIEKLHPLYFVKTPDKLLNQDNILLIPFWFDKSSNNIKEMIPFTSTILGNETKKNLIIIKDPPSEIYNPRIIKIEGYLKNHRSLSGILLFPVITEADYLSSRTQSFRNPFEDKIVSIPPILKPTEIDKWWITINIMIFVVFLAISFFLPLWLTIPLIFLATILLNLFRKQRDY